MTTSAESSLPIECLRDRLVEFLHEMHAITVVRIRPVKFHIREFLEVFGTRSLIAVCSSDLEGLRKSSRHKTLLPELTDGNTEKYIDIEVMVVSTKWSSLSTSRRHLERRSLDFEESFFLHEVPSCVPEETLPIENMSEIFIHRHIEIALSIALIVIFYTMPLLRERTDRLREEGKAFDKESSLTFMREEGFPFDSDKVSEIDELLCKFVGTHGLTLGVKFRFFPVMHHDRAILTRKHDLYISCPI